VKFRNSQGRRGNFSLGLSWRPQSEYSTNDSASGLRLGLTKPQRKFVRVFPELADLVVVPSAYCTPCMSTITPPPTPPASTIPSNSVSPSNTSSTFPSSEFSTALVSSSSITSMSMLSCPGHFDDFACALEREILWQGTLFVTAMHICFYGKQFGKIVKVMIDYRDLVSIEKEKKMGVFPSSIRIRTRQQQQQPAAAELTVTMEELEDQDPPSGTSSSEEEPATPTATATATTPTTKDYVLTSLISRDQAYSIMERNWTLHRQVLQNPSNNIGLETPQTEMSDLESQAPDMFTLDLGGDGGSGAGSRRRSGGIISSLRERRRLNSRTYSVVTDEASSSTENVNRSTVKTKKSSNRLCSPTPTNQQTDSWNVGSDDNIPQKKDVGSPSSTSESRRGSVASSSSTEKQESGLIGFIQKRRSGQFKLIKKVPDGNTSANQLDFQSDASLEQQEIIVQNIEVIYPSPPASSPISDAAIESSLPSNSARDNSNGFDLLRSCTPPILISPSLTTTKVSHSSSTVQSLARDGSQETSVHTRKVSIGALGEKAPNASNGTADATDATVAAGGAESTGMSNSIADQAPILVPASPVLPSGPVECGCQRHYKHAVASLVIPLPLELCFDICFSGKGVGDGDKLTWETHKIKDSSTDIKITPWQHENGSNASGWENQQRDLEYSVTFKMPMLAKSSTACYETQQVTKYDDFLILVHSESRTPNVPYGEHFSTVNQICMTWEAPGKTRIKCFTEVKFKKSVMWSSKVESGSLEGSGGYYKEFAKRLQELAETQGDQLIAQFAIFSSETEQPMSASAVVQDVANNDPSSATETEPHQATTSAESSRAQSLLTRQTHCSSSTTLLSLDDTHPFIELTTSAATVTKEQMISAERKSTLTTLLSSLTTPGFPGFSSVGGTSSYAVSTPATPITLTTPATPATPALWGDYVRRGLTFITRSGQQQQQQQQDLASSSPSPQRGVRFVGKSSDSLSSISSQSILSEGSNSSGRYSDPQPEGNRVKFALPTSRKSYITSRLGGSSTVRSIASAPSLRDQRHQHQQQQQQQQQQYYEKHQHQQHHHQHQQHYEKHQHQQHNHHHHSLSAQGVQQQQQQQERRDGGSYVFLSKTFFIFVVLGMVVTAVNIWHLHSAISSIVEVVNQRQDMFMISPHQRPSYHHNQHQPSRQYHDYEQYGQYDHYDQFEPYESYASYEPFLPDPRYDRSYHHYNRQVYHSTPYQQWRSREEYDALNHEPSPSSPSSDSTVHREYQHHPHQQRQQSESISQLEHKIHMLQKYEAMLNEEQRWHEEQKAREQQSQKDIAAEIAELIAKLEDARMDDEQVSSAY
ncbi:hypothetical protein BGX21_003182, partial [Mortierella sp. AD011]